MDVVGSFILEVLKRVLKRVLDGLADVLIDVLREIKERSDGHERSEDDGRGDGSF